MTFPPRIVARQGWAAIRAYLGEARMGLEPRSAVNTVVVGGLGVGKTSLICALQHFMDGSRTGGCTLPDAGPSGRTVGVQMTSLAVHLSAGVTADGTECASRTVRCSIWDVSGHEVDGGSVFPAVAQKLDEDIVVWLVVDVSREIPADCFPTAR